MNHRVSLAVVAAMAVLFAPSAQAAVARAFVASYGNDANTTSNCGATTPCRTFASALTVVSAGGEIIVLDSAGYGTLAPTQSISVIAPSGIYAGLTVADGGTVVSIATASIKVVLKGLTINGQGGGIGISMTNGAALHLDDCVISGFSTAEGTGINIAAAAEVRIANTVIRDNYYGLVAGYGANVNIVSSQFSRNSSEGVILTGGTSTTTNINLVDTLVSGSTYCIDNYANAGTTGNITATRTTVTGCGQGFSNEPDASATAGTMVVGNSTATANSVGFYNQSPGVFESLGNNQVRGNTTANTSGTITVVAAE
jgi:hypothetical protein